MRSQFVLYAALIAIALASCSHEDLVENKKQIIAGVPFEIYHKDGYYVAFCDVIKFGDRFYCVFREGETHAPYHEWHSNGYLKILSSKDLRNWDEELIVADEEWDLRDPCFCSNGNTLLLYYGLYSFENPKPANKTGYTRLEISNNRLRASTRGLVEIGDYSSLWLWKVYSFDNSFWGVAYSSGRTPILATSQDGVHFNYISEINADGTETSLVMKEDKTLVSFIRNSESIGICGLGVSNPPYEKWECFPLNEMLESPESFEYKNDMYVIGRSRYGVSMFQLDYESKELIPFYNFFAYGNYGDCGYPGIVVEGRTISVIYYSVNPTTNTTAIYQTDLQFSW